MATDAELMVWSDEEKNAFPTIRKFLDKHATSGQRQAEIDVVRFFNDRQPEFDHNVPSFNLANRKAKHAPELLIIEAIDPLTVRYLLRNLAVPDRTSFLMFLDDFLNSYPSYNFDDMQNHFQPRVSTTALQQHVCFQVMSIREFVSTPELDRDSLYEAVESGAGTWKDARLHGLLLPAQRNEDGTPTEFAPCVLSRNHFAAWFDGPGQLWNMGIILVDRPLKLDGHGARLKPPAYGRLASDDVLFPPPNTESYRTALSTYMARNEEILTGGLPVPFMALQDMYKILVSEWVVLNTYIVRDLNDIGWTLLAAHSPLRSKGKFDETLDVLFSTQWRLSWILQLVEKPLQSCREGGQTRWIAEPPAAGRADETTAARASPVAALVKDFEEVHAQLSLSSTRVEQSISHVMALTAVVHTKLGLEETGRAVTQNNMLMVLSAVAILFLPANLVSAIFNIQGDWAPGQPKFGFFWVIVLSLSALLLLLVMVLWFWTSIYSSLKRLRAPDKSDGTRTPPQLQRHWSRDVLRPRATTGMPN